MKYYNNEIPAIRIDDEFFALPEIKDTKAKFKSCGISVVIVVLERLVHRKGRVGLYKNLGWVARYLGLQVRTVIKIIDQCGVFVADHEHGLFYSPRLRKSYHMPLYLSKLEADDIAVNGNVFLGWCKKHSRKDSSFSSAEDKKNTEINDKTPVNNVPDTKTFEKESKNNSKHIAKHYAQSVDNQAECVYNRSKSKVIKSKRRSYREFRKQVSSFSISVDAADFFNIREKFKMPEGESSFTFTGAYIRKNVPPGINTG